MKLLQIYFYLSGLAVPLLLTALFIAISENYKGWQDGWEEGWVAGWEACSEECLEEGEGDLSPPLL